MAKKSTKPAPITDWMHTTAVRLARVHFVYIAAFIGSLVIFDMWNLYTHEAMLELWTAAGIMLALNTVIWFVARMGFSNRTIYLGLMLGLIVADIVFATY